MPLVDHQSELDSAAATAAAAAGRKRRRTSGTRRRKGQPLTTMSHRVAVVAQNVLGIFSENNHNVVVVDVVVWLALVRFGLVWCS